MRYKLKVCAWCEQSPKQYPCKTTRKIDGDSLEQNEFGEYLTHLNWCSIIVADSCTKETKEKYKKLSK